MTTLSYRDVLNEVFEDKDLVEYLCEFIQAYKEFGAFRISRNLPSNVIVTLVDRVKHLSEQQIEFYSKGAQDRAYDEAVQTEDLPAAANDDSV